MCCLKGDSSGQSTGIGRKCNCSTGGGAGTCCNPSGRAAVTCYDCGTCGTNSATNKCYQSAYCKKKPSSGSGNTEGDYYWPTLSDKPDQVHLLARIFLGSVCLIWSGLSQLGFLTGDSRWKDGTLSEVGKGLGSFMAAMGYDLERLNGSGGLDKNGTFVNGLLTKDMKLNELSKGADSSSVAEYYSSIYSTAQGAAKSSTTEKLCEQYPLLVLHILASGYFRAGSAGAKGVTTPAKPATSDPRKPRTIREILYWLSALPYSQGYRELVERMQQKTDQVTQGSELKLHGESQSSTTLLRDNITHYLMAACGYCPLVLIGIQGTIATSGTDSAPAVSGPPAAAADQKKCPKHSKDRNKRCTLEDANKAATQAPAAPDDGKLKAGQVCYGGYHLEVSKFGPLHGMYANGLFGFQMDLSAAQCLDQLRVYVYHCFYQLYFLRKQCSTGVDTAGKTVLGWKSCRYGSGVNSGRGVSISSPWLCKTEGSGTGKDCNCKKNASNESPLMAFLCDALGSMACKKTIGKSSDSETNPYPSIEDHMNKSVDSNGKEQDPHGYYPQLCPVPMGWSNECSNNNRNTGTQIRVNHFKDLNTGSHKTGTLQSSGQGIQNKYPVHCTGNTLSHLLEYYCDPEKCPSGTLVVLLRLLACITPTVPRTLGDLFGFYYYIVYIGGNSASGGGQGVHEKLTSLETEVLLYMRSGNDKVVEALTGWSSSGACSGGTSGCKDTLKCLYGGKDPSKCNPYLSPLSGQQYGQLSPAMAGTYLSWLVYLIEGFQEGLQSLVTEYKNIQCKDDCSTGPGGGGCGDGNGCRQGTHGDTCPSAGGSGSAGSAVGGKGGSGGVCGCASVVSCTGVLPVLYKYGFGYGNVEALHTTGGAGAQKKCHDFLGTLEKILGGDHLKTNSKGNLHHEINKLIYTTRLPWIFVLTIAWLVAVLYLAFGAIWPLDWTHMRSHCRGWFRKGSLSPWEILMVGKKKGSGILEFFGGT